MATCSSMTLGGSVELEEAKSHYLARCSTIADLAARSAPKKFEACAAMLTDASSIGELRSTMTPSRALMWSRPRSLIRDRLFLIRPPQEMGRPSWEWELKPSPYPALSSGTDACQPSGEEGSRTPLGVFDPTVQSSEPILRGGHLRQTLLACALTRRRLSSSRHFSFSAAISSLVACLLSKGDSIARACSAQDKRKSGQNREKHSTKGRYEDKKAGSGKKVVVLEVRHLRKLILRLPIARFGPLMIGLLPRVYYLGHERRKRLRTVILPHVILKIVGDLCLFHSWLPERVMDRLSVVLIREVPPTHLAMNEGKSYFQFFNLDFFLMAVIKPILLLKLYVSPVSLGAFCTVWTNPNARLV
ncbi:hypothetical protein Cgig2_010205 [Carnegiea gigantea]|uniref:Uncharacterized protein n=1 Tax=Carnegiea gigantea TaxID=171969 RepID=A0A9Q1GWT6_9CARY|nr:hypothetical protein Cgig2_010205 [Carnegiea gigantea]